MSTGEPWLDAPVTVLDGVGPVLSARLQKLGIQRVFDLLLHLPLRYQDRSRITPVARLQPGQHAQFVGRIVKAQVLHRRKRILQCVLEQDGARVTLTFFRFFKGQLKQMQAGAALFCAGEIRAGFNGQPECIHPEWKALPDGRPEPLPCSHYTAIYPLGDGLSQAQMQDLLGQALSRLPESLPPELPALPGVESVDLARALRQLHQPPLSWPQATLAQRLQPLRLRLAAEELLAHALGLRQLRRSLQAHPAPVLSLCETTRQAFLDRLPFQPTEAQLRVTAEIAADLARDRPMLRLLQGDVGAGKTLVAALATLAAVDSGYQVAILAPTEVLAEQHLQQFSGWLEPLGHGVAHLSARLNAAQRRETLRAIESGVPVVTGTHALLEDAVQFARLGLVIIDEQHRFGVHQRLRLRDKGQRAGLRPHQLIMTATPIPRTLAMTAYADLDVSVIDALPPGRTPVETRVISGQRRQEVIERIRHFCVRGQQVYWVCTLVEQSEKIQAQAAEETCRTLQQALPELQVGLLHGRMKAADKQQVMQAFKAGDIQLLVATTVIEVGVDVPNATLMIIENAERLGLAQLHQLRGRVGRGQQQSHCLLLYEPGLSETARARLDTMRSTHDGFVIAQRDLELRGPGELLGTRQKGALQFRVADLQAHQEWIGWATEQADHWLARQPDKALLLRQRWFPHAERYAEA